MTSAPVTTLYNLQIGRGVAALAVVVHHCMAVMLSYPNFPQPLYRVLYLGYFGVDFFFVLSGFIIAYVTLGMPNNRATLKHYVVSRILRVYIPYYPVALVMLLGLALLPHGTFALRDHNSLFASLTLLPSNARPALGVAWTLQHELVFYVLFAICHYVLRDWRLIFLWAIPIFAFYARIDTRASVLMVGITNLEFLCGCAAYYCYQHGWLRSMRLPLFWLGVLIIVAAISSFYGKDTDYYRVMAAPGFACIVLSLAYFEAQDSLQKYRFLLFVGAASYAIYLVHTPLLSLLMHFTGYCSSWMVAFGVCMVATITCGALYHLVVEKPTLRYLRSRLLLREHAA